MPLEIFTGSFPALERALRDELIAHPPGPGHRVAVVTGSMRLRDRVQRWLAVESGLALLNIRFHTFYSLAREVLDGGSLPLLESPFFHERIIRQVLVENGHATQAAATLAGIYAVTLRDLEEAGVDPDQLSEHFAELDVPGEKGPAFWRLMDVFRAYTRALDRLGIDTHARLARRAAAQVETAGIAAYGQLYYYGFYDLNGAQADFFAAVARQAKVQVYFPYRAGHPADRFAQRFFEVKLHVGGSPASPLAEPYSALGAVHDALFVPAAPPAPTPNLVLLNASGVRDEAWRVAKEIRALADRGVAFENMGIVARDLTPYAEFLGRILNENAIPVESPPSARLSVHPLAQVFLSLASIALEEFTPSNLLELLDSPYLAQGLWPPGTLIEARKFLERWGTGAGRTRLEALLAAASRVAPGDPENERVDDGEAMPRLSVSAAGALRAFLAKIPFFNGDGNRAWKDWSEAVRAMSDQIFSFPLGGPERAVADGLWAAMDSLLILDRLGPPSRAEFWEGLRRAVAQGELAVESRRGVRVLNAMDARGESFQALFLIGAREGAFPRIIREDPLLPDALRRLLQDPGGYWILPKREGYDEERMLFAMLARSARERLYVSYSRSREDGRPEVPSLYLRELCRASGRSAQVDDAVPRPPLERWASVPAVNRTVGEALALAVQAKRPPALFEKVLGEPGEGLAQALERAPALAQSGSLSAWDGLAGEPQRFLSRIREHGFSPTALDEYATCPFQFFARRVLHLPDERPMEPRALPPWFKGRVYHLVLERWALAALAANAWENAGALQAILDQEFDAIFSQTSPLAQAFPPLLWRVMKDQLRGHLKRLVEREAGEMRASGFRPVAVEEMLTGTAPWTPDGVAWRGRPDRLDQNTEGLLRAVDYKIRSRECTMDERTLAGQIHQPIAYMDLLAARGQAHGVFYHYVEADEEWQESLSNTSLAHHRPELKAHMDQLHGQISQGLFFIRPDEVRHCRSCPYMWTCRKAHGPTRRRAEQAS